MFARGGMAELFLARTIGPSGFEKLVVLKKILPNFAENPRFVRLFLDEAKLAASLDHPHIAHVYDLGTVDGSYFFTMEYLHGQDVRSLLQRSVRAATQLPIEHAVQIARNIASALHYAHERRGTEGKLLDVVHRDVSPANIVVSYDGAVKLLDFGVAKAATSTVKTRTGTLKGKVAYMSPEQARGASIDRRSDVFSLGIVLWEMVATRRLFKGDNDLATIQMIINEPAPDVSSFRADCPLELERITARALAKDPKDRYQTAQDLQLDLEELARETKLGQSSVALSAHMSRLFADEIGAWKTAQSNGVSLPEHISSAGIHQTNNDLTTPVSDSMLEFGSPADDLEDADELEDSIPAQLPAAISKPVAAVIPIEAPELAPIPPTPAPARVPIIPQQFVAVPIPPTPTPVVTPLVIATPTPVGPVDAVPRATWDVGESTAKVRRYEARSRRTWIIGLTATVVVTGGIIIASQLDTGSNNTSSADHVQATPTAPVAAPNKAEVAAPEPKPEPVPEPVRVEPKPVKVAPKPAPIAKPNPIAKPKPKPAVRARPPTPTPPAKKPAKPFDPDAPLPPS